MGYPKAYGGTPRGEGRFVAKRLKKREKSNEMRFFYQIQRFINYKPPEFCIFIAFLRSGLFLHPLPFSLINRIYHILLTGGEYMNNFGCCCKGNCTLLAIGASIILGIVAAVLRFMAIITVTPAFLWVVFGISVVYLAILLLVTGLSRVIRGRGCLCTILPVLISGILGAILTDVILLAITFAATSGIGTIIVGLLVFFFSLVITTTSCLVKCLADCDDNDIV